MERNDEVNVTNPTGEELQFTNPALLLNSYKKDSRRLIKARVRHRTESRFRCGIDIEEKGDIVKVELQIEKYSNFPARITVTSKTALAVRSRSAN